MAKTIYINTKAFPVQERHLAFLQEKLSGDISLIPRSPEEMADSDYANANALIGFYPQDKLASAAKLEWMQLTTAGADAFSKPGILPEQTVLTNASGAYGLTVSEHMVAMTWDLVRHFGEYRLNQAAHRWESCGDIISIEGATILLLGMGDIGLRYARIMAASGANVIGMRRHLKEKPECLADQYTIDRLHDLLGQADIVAMILPGGEETEHIIGREELQMMKKGSYLINAGRGNAIDPAALQEALESGHLRGAAIDVTEPEPLPADHPLWDVRNLLITPHVAGWWYLPETLERVVRIVGENLAAYVQGRPLAHTVNRKLGY